MFTPRSITYCACTQYLKQQIRLKETNKTMIVQEITITLGAMYIYFKCHIQQVTFTQCFHKLQ
jgi:hypothetical protein